MQASTTISFSPTSWSKWNFDVVIEAAGEDAVTAELTIASLSMKEHGSITLGDTTIDIERDRALGKEFHASASGTTLLTVKQPSLFRNRYEILIGTSTWHLEPSSAFSRKFRLRLGGQDVGWIRPESAFRRSGSAEFPRAMPAEVQLICLWLALVSWKRMSDAAAFS